MKSGNKSSASVDSLPRKGRELGEHLSAVHTSRSGPSSRIRTRSGSSPSTAPAVAFSEAAKLIGETQRGEQNNVGDAEEDADVRDNFCNAFPCQFRGPSCRGRNKECLVNVKQRDNDSITN